MVLERAALARWLSRFALSGDSSTFIGPSSSKCSSPKKKSVLEFSRLEVEWIFSWRTQGSWFEWLDCTSGSVVLECLSVSSSLLPPREEALPPRQSCKKFKLQEKWPESLLWQLTRTLALTIDPNPCSDYWPKSCSDNWPECLLTSLFFYWQMNL